MRRWIVVALAVSLALVVPAGIAGAGQNDVTRSGACSDLSSWKLKLSPQDGRIEAEYEVDQNVSGDQWRVRIRHDGQLVFDANRTTHGDSGSFDVRIVEDNNAGTDNFHARARNLSTNEVCAGSASF